MVRDRWLTRQDFKVPNCRSTASQYVYYAAQYNLPYKGEREAPYINPTRTRFAKHILFIVDESIRGDLLSINNTKLATTPYLTKLSDRMLNYGIASSAANYSSASNLIMQSGLRQDQIPDHQFRALKNPNIFSYMKRAGYRTYLVNNQLLSEVPDNLMSISDISLLDGYVLPRLSGSIQLNSEIELHSISYIMDILDKDEPSFTYLVKLGAHFPYQKGYPHDIGSVFVPAMENYAELRVDRERTTNSYLNTVRWNVDVFFENLVPYLEGRDVLVVYTSDHGQSLMEGRGGSTTRGHGTGRDPSVFEVNVPLFLLPMSSDLHDKLTPLFNERNLNRVSGFQMFPSLLYLAGYDRNRVVEIYDETIFDERTVDDRAFLSGNLFGLGNLNPFDATAPLPKKD